MLMLGHSYRPNLSLETSYPSRRIIRQKDNSSKYKSEHEFCSIIRLDIYACYTTGVSVLRSRVAKI